MLITDFNVGKEIILTSEDGQVARIVMPRLGKLGIEANKSITIKKGLDGDYEKRSS